jgi:hypothetical protein
MAKYYWIPYYFRLLAPTVASEVSSRQPVTENALIRNKLALAVVTISAIAALPAAGQGTLPQTIPTVDSVTVVPGPEYKAGWITRFLVGSGYRDLWTTPIRVPVLDLDRFAGGLTVRKQGSTGGQTWSLHMYGADGNEYLLRSLDKHVKLAAEVSSGTVAWLLRDQISAGFATGALVVAPLMRASGVLHEDVALVVLPDSPRLGQYRKQFAGLLVWVEGRARGPGGPEEIDPDAPGFAGASKIVKTEKMMKEISSSPDEHFDSRAYLTARLMDIVIGDWDRGHLQWWFARFGEKHDHLWRPVPHDRDWAFANHDGALYSLVRPNVPWFVKYQPHYPNLIGLESQAWGMDRRLLQDLERPVWDSTAAWLKAQLTDAVIDDAVAQLPPPEQKLYGERMRRALRGRRDALPWMAASFYKTVAGQADVHAVAVPSVIDITRRPDTIEIRMQANQETYYDRRFDVKTTREVRLYLDGGSDSVAVTGGGDGIMVRLVSGGNGNVLVDQDAAHAGPTQVYDGGHPVRVVHGSPLVDSRPYTAPTLGGTVVESNRQPADFLLRDAGSWCAPVSNGELSTYSGLTLETGFRCSGFGFRRIPYGIEQEGTVGYTIGPGGFVGNYRISVRATGGSPVWSLALHGTSSEYAWFYGIGNETPHHLPDDDFRARQSHFTATPTVTFVPTPNLTLTLGSGVRYWDTERRPLFFRKTQPYGSGAFGSVVGTVGAAFDTRTVNSTDTDHVRVEVSGRAVPDVWNATSTYGTAHAEASAFLVLRPLPTQPYLRVRVGGDKLWGTAPFQDLPSVGGTYTVRGYFNGRFTGDAAVYNQTELFIPLFTVNVIAPAAFGVMGLNDVGRVFAAGDHSSAWHDGIGGGVWTAFLRNQYVLTLTAVHGSERTVISGGFGVGW